MDRRKNFNMVELESGFDKTPNSSYFGCMGISLEMLLITSTVGALQSIFFGIYLFTVKKDQKYTQHTPGVAAAGVCCPGDKIGELLFLR